jgi:hypothetical protein
LQFATISKERCHAIDPPFPDPTPALTKNVDKEISLDQKDSYRGFWRKIIVKRLVGDKHPSYATPFKINQTRTILYCTREGWY